MAVVRCADCGFLAVRDRQSRELIEVEVDLRKRWVIPKVFNSSLERYEAFPLCLRHKADLRIEAATYRQEDVITLLDQPRDCDEFTEWRHGLSPKEHLEMRLAQDLQRQQQELREREREWRERQDAEQRQWQEAEAEKARSWQKAEHRANRRVHIFLTFVGIAVTCALAYFGYSVTRFGQPPVKNIPTELRP